MVEGARLESVYTVNAVSRVRISHSPPFLYPFFGWIAEEAEFFFRSGHSALVLRNGVPRTSSGPEGSSDKRVASCAVRVPGDCGPTWERIEVEP